MDDDGDDGQNTDDVAEGVKPSLRKRIKAKFHKH